MSKKSVAERKKEREQSKQRSQVQYGLLAFVVIAAIAAVVYFAATSVPSDAAIPPYLDRTDIFLSDTTTEGYPRLGNPNAPVEVREFASFACAGCLTFHEEVFPQLLPLIESGQMSFVFVPLTTGSVPNPNGANRTAVCAGAQGKFWQMHDVLFSWHSLYGNGAFQDGRLRAAVGALGLDSTTFNSCINSDSTNAVLNSALAEGVGSTPSVTVNGTAVEANYQAIVTAVSGLVTGAPVESGLKPSNAVESTPEAVVPTTEAVEDATEEAVAPTTEAVEDATEEAVVPTTEAVEDATEEAVVPTTEALEEATEEAAASAEETEAEQSTNDDGASAETESNVALQSCSDEGMRELAGFTLANWDRVAGVNFTYEFDNKEIYVSRTLNDYSIILPIEESLDIDTIRAEYVYLEDVSEFHFQFQHGLHYYSGDIYELETMTISQNEGIEVLRLFAAAIANCG